MRRLRLITLALPLMLLAACNRTPDAEPTGAVGSGVQAHGGRKSFKIGYVLHGLNDFTKTIQQGAEDAGKDLGVDVEVVGPSEFKATEEISIFEGMIQKKKDGLAVVPMPGDQWVVPIKEATDAGIPVATANVTSAQSSSESWFGQDEYQSGITLATEMKKMLAAQGIKSGTILAGVCMPGVAVLEARYKGFKKGLEGSAYTVTDPKNVGTANTENYGAWENLATANPSIVAAAGFCSMDIPNLAQLKKKSGAKWLIGGYDLTPVALESIKDGTTQISLGQNPYLQGYLPVLALVRHLRDKKPMPRGWVNVGTEIITKANVESVMPRENDRAAETKWYADHIAKNFTDMNAMATSMPKP